MKRLALMAVLFLLAGIATAQTKVVKTGNNTYKMITVNKKDSVIVIGTLTDNKGQQHPIYKGPKEGIYYIVVDSTGKKVKRYIKVDK